MNYKDTYKVGHMVLPSALLFNFNKLFTSADEFLVWQFFYLQSTTNIEDFPPRKIAESIGKSLAETNQFITNLTKQGLLDIKTIHLDGKTELYFDVSPLFEKLEAIGETELSQHDSNVDEENTIKLLVADFERELGRLMSPFELEDLQKLVSEDYFSPDLIRTALKEAVFNGKTNWKYITAILRNWRKEGISTVRQVEEQKLGREQKQNQQVSVSDDFLNAMDLWSE